MPFDAAMLKASLAECREALAGGRVEKISVPEKELVVFSFHTVREGKSCNRKLEISTYPDLSCVHLTEISVENPAVPSAFCLQLRKYLLGARLTAIEQLGFERAVLFSFSAKDE
ncbi:MAG: NFACT family protein, partial [Clostridia bacterium]|nr:NFACT family protein [Clostridia bacterium]